MTTLIVDGNNIAYKAFYTTGALSADGLPTGVLFGALKMAFSVCKKLAPDNVVFAFDSRHNKRREIAPEYKVNRKLFTGEQAKQRQFLYNQINDLQLIVRRIGFPVYREDGYEADDLIASLTMNNKYLWNEKMSKNNIYRLPTENKFVILSTDRDLYQLLENNSVSMWQMTDNELYSYADFCSEYGIAPYLWPQAKAIMGDPGDNVIGLKGIGIKTAIKYLLNGKISTVKEDFIGNNMELVERNLKLVKLPFDGTPELMLEQYNFNSKVFFNIVRRYKMYSLKIDEWEKLFC